MAVRQLPRQKLVEVWIAKLHPNKQKCRKVQEHPLCHHQQQTYLSETGSHHCRPPRSDLRRKTMAIQQSHLVQVGPHHPKKQRLQSPRRQNSLPMLSQHQRSTLRQATALDGMTELWMFSWEKTKHDRELV